MAKKEKKEEEREQIRFPALAQISTVFITLCIQYSVFYARKFINHDRLSERNHAGVSKLFAIQSVTRRGLLIQLIT